MLDAHDMTVLIGEQAIAIRVLQEEVRERDAKLAEQSGHIEELDKLCGDLVIEREALTTKVQKLQAAKKTQRRRGK